MKKSLYVFLCSIMGMLLFLILHRLMVFAYLLLVSSNPQVFGANLNYLELVAIDLFSLILTLFLGAWYGIWLGLNWYEDVYETGRHGGLVDHLVKTCWPKSKARYDLRGRVESVAKELKEDVWQLENLARTSKQAIKATKPIRRRIVRKRAAAKSKPSV